MYFRLFLATTTALGLLSSVAYADSNETYLTQTGNLNAATILQDGRQNRAGKPAAGAMVQNGDNNIIFIDQTGPSSPPNPKHSRSRASVGEDGNGVDQIGDNNRLQIIQVTTTTNWATSVGEVQQTANGVSGLEVTNDVSVNQNDPDGRSSTVLRIRQTYTGDGTIAGDRNLVTIDQTGGSQAIGRLTNSGSRGAYQNGVGNTIDVDQAGSLNGINFVSQTGAYNIATLNQNGTSNVIFNTIQTGDNNDANISQTGNNNLLSSLTQTGFTGGLGNTASLSFSGNNNGQGTFSAQVGSLGLAEATVLQQGDDNDLSYSVIGGGNLYAFSQVGNSNTTTGTVSGDNNQMAVLQNGDSNNSSASQTGTGNRISVTQ